MKKKLALLTLTMILSITACGKTQTTVIQDNIKANIIYNTESVKSEIENLLTSGVTTSADMYTDDFYFDESDTSVLDESYRHYFSDGAYYVQTGTYMYRFQFNNDGKITSYIKYNLEG